MKRIFSGALALLMVLVMMPGQSFAANTEDTVFWFKSQSLFSSFHTAPRAKEDTTPVYVYVYNCPSQNYLVRAERKAANGSWILDNEGGAVTTLRRDVKYSLHTLIYEHSGRLARLGVTVLGTGYVEGVWSPDSQGHYVDAW
ncbi:MAG: hypothetical protein SOR89_04635 [Ndongobacter sp.]|nr:hypothetical protein [Ndongobacter sp.]